MLEVETREWIAYGLITGSVLSASLWWALTRRRRYWRKLRMRGDHKAKRRELGKR